MDQIFPRYRVFKLIFRLFTSKITNIVPSIILTKSSKVFENHKIIADGSRFLSLLAGKVSSENFKLIQKTDLASLARFFDSPSNYSSDTFPAEIGRPYIWKDPIPLLLIAPRASSLPSPLSSPSPSPLLFLLNALCVRVSQPFGWLGN